MDVLSGHIIQLGNPAPDKCAVRIAAETHRIETCLMDTLERSGLAASEIDAVVRTGGLAQIPCFVEMLGRVFGLEKVVLTEIFSGVTAGLAIRAGIVL